MSGDLYLESFTISSVTPNDCSLRFRYSRYNVLRDYECVFRLLLSFEIAGFSRIKTFLTMDWENKILAPRGRSPSIAVSFQRKNLTGNRCHRGALWRFGLGKKGVANHES